MLGFLLGALALGLAAAAGVQGLARAGPPGAAAGALVVLAAAVALWPFVRRGWARGLVLSALTGAGTLAAGWWGGPLPLAGVALALLALGLFFRAPLPGGRRRPPFVGVVTVISVVGVGIGVMALIVVLSVMSGFEADLKSKILGAHAHVVVEKYGDDFVEFAAVEARVREAPGVKSAAAFVLGDAMMSTDAGLSGSLIKGIDPASEDASAELADNLERGRVSYLLEPEKIPGACGKTFLPPRPPSAGTSTTPGEPLPLDAVALGGAAECTGRVLPGVIIGKELSRALRAYVGDVVKLVSPVSDEIGPLGPTPKLRRYRVAGIFFSGMYEYDAKLAYVAMERAQRFFGKRGEATGVELKIEDIDASGLVVADLERRLGGRPYRVKDWREMNKELFSALLLEKIAMFVALTMIIMVASFLIVATLVMIVLQRGREIAILKSVGASSASVMKIFVIQGVIVGVGGALLGVGAGVGICYLLETVGLRLDERVFYIEKLPVVLDGTEVGVIAASAMIITYLATIYPAMTAAILRPWTASEKNDMSELVRIEGLTKTYWMDEQPIEVLRGVDLSIHAGDRVSIIGPSGSGKSTFLHVLGTLDAPTAGTVRYEGEDVFARSPGAVAAFRNRTIGFVFQFHHLLPEFSALENVAMPALIQRQSNTEANRRAAEVLERVGLGHRLSHRPGELSGGEQQRVAIARALALEPRLLLADEPTGNLDEATAAGIHELLDDMNRQTGLTVMLVTHSSPLAARMPRQLEMREGRLLERAEAVA